MRDAVKEQMTAIRNELLAQFTTMVHANHWQWMDRTTAGYQMWYDGHGFARGPIYESFEEAWLTALLTQEEVENAKRRIASGLTGGAREFLSTVPAAGRRGD